MTNGWVQTNLGEWRRPLGGLEKTYRFTSTRFEETGREHWGLYTSCRVEFGPHVDSVPNTLRTAWMNLRLEFPGLAVTLDGYEAVYQSIARSPTQGLEAWADQTFVIQSDEDKTVDQILAEYNLNNLPGLVYFPKTSEVLFLTSHWRVDALGCCLLVDRLFALVAADQGLDTDLAGQEISLLSPSLEDAVGAPDTPTEKIQSDTMRMLSSFRQKALASLGIGYRGDRLTPPGHAAYQSMVLTPEASDRLVLACKARQLSVSAAVFVALSRAVFNLNDSGADEYSTIMAVNMRPYLREPYGNPSHACQAYVSSITPTVRRSEAFDASARALTSYFKTWHNQDFDQCLREAYRMQSNALLHAPPQPSTAPPSGVTFSSLGVIERNMNGRYGGDKVVVKDFRFGVSMLTRQMLLYVWSFGGRLSLSINYNKAYYGREKPKAVLGHVRTTLEAEMGVHLDVETVAPS